MFTNGGGKKAERLEHKPYEIVDGKARLVFSKEEDMLAEKCRMTVVGRFSRTRLQIDKLRDEFKKSFPMRGTIKIGAYDWRHIFMDFPHEEDFKRHYGRRSMVAMERILEPLGLLIALDKANMSRSRPTIAKTRVEIDLTKPRLNEVEVALTNNN